MFDRLQSLFNRLAGVANTHNHFQPNWGKAFAGLDKPACWRRQPKMRRPMM